MDVASAELASYMVSTSVWVRVCPTLPNVQLTCRHQQSFLKYVGGGIFIPAVNHMTLRTFPFSDREVFDQRIFVPAQAAGLATRVEGWNLYDLPAIP